LKVIDGRALAAGPMRGSPYPHVIIGRSFQNAEDSSVLCDQFVMSGFKHDVRGANAEGKKQYRANNYQLLDYGRRCEDHLARLTPRWQDLFEDVCSPEYRAAAAACTGVDLSGTVLDIRLVLYGKDDWIEPHVDRADKVVTHLFYLNTKWSDEWSGALRILASSDIEDYTQQVFPHAGVSVIMVRTENSWHAVPPVNSRAPEPRRVLLVHFVRP
jgi:Rps23 Pro-64 3,4-dihydroxylase Tpa1-like proline 4-hydroxylase